MQRKLEKFFIYFSEVFYFIHLLSEKIIMLVQILTEIQNLTKFIKTASENNKTKKLRLLLIRPYLAKTVGGPVHSSSARPSHGLVHSSSMRPSCSPVGSGYGARAPAPPRLGRNLGLGRESGSPACARLGQPSPCRLYAVDADRTATRAFRRIKNGARPPPPEP